MTHQFKHVVAAGSWDHFHQGHQIFLQAAVGAGERITVGVTSEAMIAKKPFAVSMESFERRRQNVVDYMSEQGWDTKIKLERLDDIYGPAILDNSIEALLVTLKTKMGGELVNKALMARGMPILQLIEVPLAMAHDGKEISSQRIREGKINREGLVYMDLFNTDYILPENLRGQLQKPFGLLLQSEQLLKKIAVDKPAAIISVGDVVTKLFVDFGLKADMFVVDLLVERKKRYGNLNELGLKDKNFVRVKNPAGDITKELVEKIQEGKNILVDGEEDLAVLPAILALPLGSVVVYGQPGEGLVWVDVTEEKKKEAYQLIQQFIPLRPTSLKLRTASEGFRSGNFTYR